MSSAWLHDLREEVWRGEPGACPGRPRGALLRQRQRHRPISRLELIKPSGVPYDELRSEHLVAVSLEDGQAVEGTLRPSLDTPTHLALYRRHAEIGGVVHTHSIEASAWAQAARSIPPLGTTHADHFHGAVPVTRQLTADEIQGDYELETGRVIIETLDLMGLGALEMPAVLVASQGPFTWGANATAAVENAVALEAVAAAESRTFLLVPNVGSIPEVLLERHYRRKHGPDAYYG